MSHVSECIQLYRHDLFVSNDDYGKLIADAHERDLADADRDEAPAPELEAGMGGYPGSDAIGRTLTEPEPFSVSADLVGEAMLRRARRLSVACQTPSTAERWALAAASAADAYPDTAADPSAADVAKLILEQWEQVVEAIETTAQAVSLLNDVDTTRGETIAALTETVSVLAQRMDLRADECRALNARIESVTRLVMDRIERLA